MTNFGGHWRDPDGGILRHWNISACFKSWKVQSLEGLVKPNLPILTLLTWTALMCPVGALDARDVRQGKTPRVPPLLFIQGRMLRVSNVTWQKQFKLKGITNNVPTPAPNPLQESVTLLWQRDDRLACKHICRRPLALHVLRVADCKFVLKLPGRVDYGQFLKTWLRPLKNQLAQQKQP